MIKLKRPLIFFDLEATGKNVIFDRIIQIGAIKYSPDGKSTEHEWMLNPKMPISKEATEVHGITDEDVADSPTFGDLAKELAEFFADCDLAGYNVRYFDIPMLQNEFRSIGMELDLENINIIDSMTIFKLKEPRNLQAAYEKYVGGEFKNAHNAMADIKATIEVFEGQLKMYKDLPKSTEQIHEFCFPPDPDAYDPEGKLRYVDGELCINFGKNMGKSLKELAQNDPGYLNWILNGSFSEKVKNAVREAFE